MSFSRSLEEIKQQVPGKIQETVPKDETPDKVIDDEWHNFHQEVTLIPVRLPAGCSCCPVRLAPGPSPASLSTPLLRSVAVNDQVPFLNIVLP